MTGQPPLFSLDETEVIGADPWLETRLDHPEDVAVAADGTLYTGGENGQVYEIDPETNAVTEIANTGGFILGLEIGPDGELYACDFQNHAVYRIAGDASPTVEAVVSSGPDSPPWHPNAIAFASDGRMYVSDSGDRSDMANAGGCIYCVDPDGHGHVLTDEVSAFPNGVSLSKDEQTLYVAETGTHSLFAIHLAGEPDVEFLTDECGMVDGIALDAADSLYVASIGDNAVYRLQDGAVETIVRDPTGLEIGNPTNIAFGGPDMRRLYIANLALWHLTALEIDTDGRYPSGRQ